MMIVMKPNATQEEIEHVLDARPQRGARAHISKGEEVTVIGAIGDREHVARLELEGAPGVAQVVPILKPYKLSSAQLRRRRALGVRDRRATYRRRALRDDRRAVHGRVARAGARDRPRSSRTRGAAMFRGGAYKPRTSPYAFQGLGQEGLRLLAEAKASYGMPIVTELMDVA